VSYLSKFAYVNLPHLHLAPLLRVTPIKFCRDLSHQKIRSPWAIMWHCLRYAMCRHFDTILACDSQTNRQMDRHMTTANAHASIVSHGYKCNFCTSFVKLYLYVSAASVMAISFK